MPHDRIARTPVAAYWTSLDAALQRWWVPRPGGARVNALRVRLHGFMRWAKRISLAPELVDDAAILRYISESAYKAKSGYHAEREARLRKAWNYAACVVPSWPAVWVTPPRSQKTLPTRSREGIVAFPRHQYHPELVAEVDRYVRNRGFLGDAEREIADASHRERLQSRLGWLNSLPEESQLLAYPARRMRPLAEATLYSQTRLVYQTATALHLAGEADVRDLRRIADVVTSAGAAALADVMTRRLGPDIGGPAAAKWVRYFASVARRCGLVLSIAEREALRQLMADLYAADGPVVDISEKNLRLLAQFDDPAAFAMLVALPSFEMGELRRARRRGQKPTLQEAGRARNAVATEILNTLPLRVGTLVQLDIERNFIGTPGEAPRLVAFPGQEKSRKTLEAQIAPQSWKLISYYVRHYRPVLPGADRSTHLFPGTRDRPHVRSTAFAREIAKFVKRRIGVHMNVHLWRHVMSTKLVDMTRQPEDAERLLGHTPGSAATKRYIRLRSREAARLLHEVTEEALPEGLRLLRARSGSRQSPNNPLRISS